MTLRETHGMEWLTAIRNCMRLYNKLRCRISITRFDSFVVKQIALFLWTTNLDFVGRFHVTPPTHVHLFFNSPSPPTYTINSLVFLHSRVFSAPVSTGRAESPLMRIMPMTLNCSTTKSRAGLRVVGPKAILDPTHWRSGPIRPDL